MLVPTESSSAVLVMINCRFVSICNRFYARRANNGKKNDLLEGYHSSVPSFEGNLLTQRHEICSRETRDSTLSYGRNPVSLSYLGLNRYRVVTDGQTDEQADRVTITNTRCCRA